MRKQRKQWPIKQRRHQDGAIYTQRNILLWKNPLRHKSVSTTKNIIKTIQVISSCGFGECEQRHYKDFCFLDNSIAGNKKIIKKIHLYVTVLGINIPNVEQPLPTHTFGMKRPKSTAFMNCSLLTCVNGFCRTIVWERELLDPDLYYHLGISTVRSFHWWSSTFLPAWCSFSYKISIMENTSHWSGWNNFVRKRSRYTKKPFQHSGKWHYYAYICQISVLPS